MAVTHSVSKRSLKSSYVRNQGKSSEQQALMVKIEWTKALIVTITATKNFQMTTSTMSISRKTGYQAVSTQKISIQDGMKLYFVRSSEDGWYYIVRWSENFQQFSCTCPAGRMKHSCKHIEQVTVYALAYEEPVVSITIEEVAEEVKRIIQIAEEMAQQKQDYQDQHQAEIDAGALVPTY